MFSFVYSLNILWKDKLTLVLKTYEKSDMVNIKLFMLSPKLFSRFALE